MLQEKVKKLREDWHSLKSRGSPSVEPEVKSESPVRVLPTVVDTQVKASSVTDSRATPPSAVSPVKQGRNHALIVIIPEVVNLWQHDKLLAKVELAWLDI